jgi:aminoglycoside phosphotransferase (APT) family kinase protein
MMAETLSIATLTELVRPHLPNGATSLRLTPIRTGKHNASFWVDSDQGRFVLRVAPPDDTGFLFYERWMMRQEPELHTLIRARTSIPVAEVVAADFSRTHIDRDFVLMTALPGMPLSDAAALGRSATNHALRQIGGYLRQLHALTALDCLGLDAYGYLGAHRPMEPQPTWWDAFRVMWHKLWHDVVVCDAYTSAEADAFRDLLDQHREHLERPVTSCLLHMDVWSQNILVDGRGSVTGLVDFDRALWGDVEIEFAVLDYCGISQPAFWEGYGQPRDESASAEIRRMFYLLYEVQKYMPIHVRRRNDPQGAAHYKQHSLAMAAQLGL